MSAFHGFRLWVAEATLTFLDLWISRFFGFYDFVDWSMPGRTGPLGSRVPRDWRFVDLRGLLISGCFDLCDLGGPCISRFLGFMFS